MKTPNMYVWSAALRSGHFSQGKGQLAREEHGTVRYCCLGVGCVKADIEPHKNGTTIYFNHHDSMPPVAFREWLGLPADENRAVVVLLDVPSSGVGWPHTQFDVLNDNHGLSFPQIADLIDYFGVV
jgi:hypothetical protein